MVKGKEGKKDGPYTRKQPMQEKTECEQNPPSDARTVSSATHEDHVVVALLMPAPVTCPGASGTTMLTLEQLANDYRTFSIDSPVFIPLNT